MTVVANFTANPADGKSPLTVQFNDLSSGSPDFWYWDFGDGNFSTTQHPVHTYVNSGEYSPFLLSGVKTTVTSVKPGAAGGQRKINVPRSTEAVAWAEYQAAPWVGTGGASPACQHMVSNYPHPITHGEQWVYESWRRSGNFINLSGMGSYDFAYLVLRGVALNNLTPGIAWGFATNKGPVPAPSLCVQGGAALDIVNEPVTSYLGGWLPLELFDLQYGRIGLGQNRGICGQEVGYIIRGDQDVPTGTHVVALKFSSWDNLTKPGYIRVDMEYCGKGWIMISRRVVSVLPLVKNLVVETDKKSHLFAWYMRGVPSKLRVWRVKYGMPYRCAPRFTLKFEGSVEQAESGDTRTHTFNMLVMPRVKELTIVLKGSQCGVVGKGRTPIMEYDNQV